MVNRRIFRAVLMAGIFLFLIIGGYVWSGGATQELLNKYEARQSVVHKDRHGELLKIASNGEGYYAQYLANPSEELKRAVIEREDRFFYFHPGVNVVSIARAIGKIILGENNPPSSTITQQLTKVLLGQEGWRNWRNKLVETAYALALEMRLSKDEILTMYLNSIYLGNRMQGVSLASRLYFDTEAVLLSDEQIDDLVETIRSPSVNNPFEGMTAEVVMERKQKLMSELRSEVALEWDEECRKRECRWTVDKELSEQIRQILKNHLALLNEYKAENGAVVVIKLPANEVLATIGTPDPLADYNSYQVDMTRQQRPIGSTVKPFIYGAGWEAGLRPYTLVDDQEYRYEIADGFAFYPKNYDYQYRGRVDLHYALANSLNVPTVKVLEYVGLENFYKVLGERLGLDTGRALEQYQLGIAMGTLDMTPLQLAHYFTVFSQHGYLRPLRMEMDVSSEERRPVYQESTVQLLNKILSERVTGVEQFGVGNNLEVDADNVAVKTGTSSEYRDSWTVGYSPDFLVAVWVGNADNSPMEGVSGSVGAGAIYNDVMRLLLDSEYNRDTLFADDRLKEVVVDGQLVYGLPGDQVEVARGLLIRNDLIISPHDQDLYLYEEGVEIPLEASAEGKWYLEDREIVDNKKGYFTPPSPGEYQLEYRVTDGMNEWVEIEFKVDD